MAFLLNPYLGDVNPATADGLKLYNKAVAAPESKLTLAQKHSKDILEAFETDSSNFGWGPAISAIQIDAAGLTRSILTNARELTLEMVQKSARRTWLSLAPAFAWADPLPADFTIGAIDPAANVAQRPQFYRRTRSIMIAKRIEASLDQASLQSLMLERKSFTWTEANGTIHFDGPTMLFLILSKVNPSVRVGISTLKTSLTNSTLPQFKHNVVALLDSMHKNYTQIYKDGGTHDDYTLHLYNALESSNNSEFLSFLRQERSKWETSTVIQTDAETSSNLRKIILEKYNNMLLAKRWKKTEDPSAKVISALMTKVASLEGKISSSSGKHHANATDKSKTPKLHIPQWRTEKKGDKVDKDGKTWWWCPHHKREGLFDGLYMPHKPSEHDEWKKKKDEKRAAQKGKRNGDSSSSSKGSKSKLQLTDAMRNALVTDGNMTAEQANALWSKLQEN